MSQLVWANLTSQPLDFFVRLSMDLIYIIASGVGSP